MEFILTTFKNVHCSLNYWGKEHPFFLSGEGSGKLLLKNQRATSFVDLVDQPRVFLYSEKKEHKLQKNSVISCLNITVQINLTACFIVS